MCGNQIPLPLVTTKDLHTQPGVCGELLFRQLRVVGIVRGNEISTEIG